MSIVIPPMAPDGALDHFVHFEPATLVETEIVIILLCTDTLIPIGDVPPHIRCARNVCRQCFDAYLT